jgi:hypothetical protein
MAYFLMASFVALVAPFFTFFSIFAFGFLHLSMQRALATTCNSYKRFLTMGPHKVVTLPKEVQQPWNLELQNV